MERVRQPALGPEAHALADAALVARLELVDVEVHGRPPSRELANVAENARDVADRAEEPPLAPEAELGGVPRHGRSAARARAASALEAERGRASVISSRRSPMRRTSM